jgi:Tol biopolymer transport system component
MRDGLFPTRRMASLMRGPLCALLRRSALVVVIGLLLLALAPGGALANPGITERVSVASDGAQAIGDYGSVLPTISADGRYVAFESDASNLVADDTNGVCDAFVHDRQTGETTRVSVATDGTQGECGSWAASISTDGRYVAFSSYASTLAAGDTNGREDIFLHDRQTGETTRVSVATNGTQGNHDSTLARNAPPSADGRYVAFLSLASNLVPDDTNGTWDVFVHDCQTGETRRVSVASDGAQANGGSWWFWMSADGRYVGFQSVASNLVPDDTNDTQDVFLHELATAQTTRVSVASDATQANSASGHPSLSDDARYVAFFSRASNLVADDTNATWDIFVHDRQTGETTRVSVATDGTQANSTSYYPSISADGRHVAFWSSASNLVLGDTNNDYDVFLHDRETGDTVRVSVADDGTEGDDMSWDPSVSADGRCVAFDSTATNLVPDDTNGVFDIFVHDRWPLPQLPYQFGGFLPPLHDGTSANAPDGPFKRGRTIPVKFQLLDSEGQPISDEEAQGLVAELAVFYEEPCNQGDPIDPGDSPPDIGDQFRYDAEADLFIYNLSTKATVWYADYTYGLEVLIDGIKAAEVYFSLR